MSEWFGAGEPPSALDRLAEAAQRVADADEQAKQARAERLRLIREALAEGRSARAVSEAAGVSRQRVQHLGQKQTR